MLSEKSLVLKVFNQHFHEFIGSVASAFPANADLAAAVDSFELIRRANPTVIVKAWKQHVYLPYREVIDAGDLDFVVSKNYAGDLAMFSNVDEILQIIDRLREPIKQMVPSQKERTMKYMETLSKLSMLYG